MPATSLKERIAWLERELPPHSPRFKIYDDLPFAILAYRPGEEWSLRRELRHLGTRLGKGGIDLVQVPLAELLWHAIDKVEGIEPLVALERAQGFLAAQTQVNTYLTDRDFCPLPDLLAARLEPFDPQRTVAFLTRASSLGPDLYHLSALLEQMQGRTRVPTVLCFPGTLVDTSTLRFLDLPDRETFGSYRVKVYG